MKYVYVYKCLYDINKAAGAQGTSELKRCLENQDDWKATMECSSEDDLE